MHKNNTQKQGTFHYNQTLINTTLYYFWGKTPPTSMGRERVGEREGESGEERWEKERGREGGRGRSNKTLSALSVSLLTQPNEKSTRERENQIVAC